MLLLRLWIDHTCPTTVQMHIAEELHALFGTDEDVLGDKQTELAETEDDNLCVLSIHAVAGRMGPASCSYMLGSRGGRFFSWLIPGERPLLWINV